MIIHLSFFHLARAIEIKSNKAFMAAAKATKPTLEPEAPRRRGVPDKIVDALKSLSLANKSALITGDCRVRFPDL